MHRANGFPPPENPLLSIFKCMQSTTCTIGNGGFTSDFYIISFKKIKSGEMIYGRTKYDHDSGTMSFIKPRQVIGFNNIQLQDDGFVIYIHEDYLNGHPLHAEIKKYGYFEYESNEALHLSPKEESLIWDLYAKIDAEYHTNPDIYSKDIILTHIDSILKYSQRFYQRQFINRASLSGKLMSKFNEQLSVYATNGSLQNKGLPTVKQLASQLNISSRYLSDLLKQETGKTAIELIHIYLISEAKNLLIIDSNSISEIAYTLGFENLPYFSRLFKKEVGLSPVQYKKQYLN